MVFHIFKTIISYQVSLLILLQSIYFGVVLLVLGLLCGSSSFSILLNPLNKEDEAE